MKGSYRIVAQNSKIRYDFEINRNITVIKGDSATGKTTLVELIREYYEDGEESGINLSCEKECAVLDGRDWENALKNIKDTILFIDEGNRFVHSKDFARAIQKTDNYYVIVTREGLVNLPYSVEEIYGIRESGKYASTKQIYNEFYRLYGVRNHSEKVSPSRIIVEDSNSGFDFFDKLSKDQSYEVSSANGKSNIFSEILRNQDEKTLLVIADGAAFGAEMERIMKLVEVRDNLVLYLPESFEWLILKSGVLKNNQIDQMLDEPAEYIESREYFSWERFFTSVLIENTRDSYLAYAKKKLNEAYLGGMIEDAILKQMEKIELGWKKEIQENKEEKEL